MTTPSVSPSTPRLPLPLHINGLEAWIESYAILDNTIVSLGLFGRAAILEAIAANLLLTSSFTVDQHEHVRWPTPQTLTLRRFRKTLPSGHAHYLWIPLTACPAMFAPQTPAYLLLNHHTATNPPALFETLINRLLACPILPVWLPALWQWGLDTAWIQPASSFGIHLWKIHPDEDACREWIHTHLSNLTLPIESNDTPAIHILPSSEHRIPLEEHVCDQPENDC